MDSRGLVAITRAVSPSLDRCELTHLDREPIDVAKAEAQHRAYEDALRASGLTVVTLPAEPDFPDSMFVEDAAVVLPELAVITRPGAESRRGELLPVAQALHSYRGLRCIETPGTIDGGDVLVLGHRIFIGRSSRTNDEGIRQFAAFVEPYGYFVTGVEVCGCLHLKSAACPLGDAVLLNPDWIDPSIFGVRSITVHFTEPHAANVLAIGDTVLVAASFPETAAILASEGWNVRTLDISELQKAESGLTCSSLIFSAVSDEN